MGWGDKNYVGQPSRLLRDKDVLGWMEAADQRPQQRTRESIIRAIRRRNPIRWRRLQHEIRWVQKEMKKAGLNPEEWRYLL